MKRALERHERGEARVIPIILCALAQADEAQTAEALFNRAQLDEATGQASLKVLLQHDVIMATQTSKVLETFEVLYDFAVPLMR
jgi:hypothetical protein